MKPLKESSENRKRKRHDSQVPRINTLKKAKKHRAKTNKKFIDKNRWRKFYGSKAWHNLREAKLHDQPLCEECLEHDIIRPAVDIHHVIPFGQGIDEQQQWELFLDYDNLMSLCKECHRKKHKYREHIQNVPNENKSIPNENGYI